MAKKCFICECELPNSCRRFMYKGVRHYCASAELSWYKIRYLGFSDEEMDQWWENDNFHESVIALLTQRGTPAQCPECNACFVAKFENAMMSRPAARCPECYRIFPVSPSENIPDDAAIAKCDTVSRAIQRCQQLINY